MTPTTTTGAALSQWVQVCRYDDLEPERGAAALLEDGVQVALFRLADGSVHAVDHHDPVSGANVIARGIVGSRGEVPTIASPMYKDVYDLTTGVCLDNPELRLRVFGVRVDGGVVSVRAPAGPG